MWVFATAVFRRNLQPNARGAFDPPLAPLPKGAAFSSADIRRPLSRRLAGATVLQLVPSLRDEPATRTAIHVAAALQRAGARALVAGGEGPLIAELRAQGAEWLPLDTATVNPLKLRRNASALERFLAAERVDIVHAHGAGAAWSALAATDRMAVWLVTSLPDMPPPTKSIRGLWQSALGRGDRVIAQSSFAAGLMIERFGIARDRVAVVPHGIDPLLFDPAAMRPERVMALRQTWNIPKGDRVVLLPGQIRPASGQLILLEAAHWLVRNGLRGVTFVEGRIF